MDITDSTSTGPGAMCGDGVVDEGEDCDGTDLGDETCVAQGFAGGELDCDADCTFDTTMCTDAECGNGAMEGTEVCDTDDLGGATCLTEGFDTGVLACAHDCTLDITGCVSFMCGNDVIEGAEVCDGADLAGEDCVSQGFASGALGCAENCMAYDTTGCLALPACVDEDIGSVMGLAVAVGNNAGDDDDINALCGGPGGPDHVMQWTAPAAGLYHFDTFESGFDTKLALYSDCATEVSCNDDTGGMQSQLNLDMVAGQTIFIVLDGFNGATGDWVLNISEGAICGDGVANTPEVCDGADVGEVECADAGLMGGAVGCVPDCSAYELSTCNPPAGYGNCAAFDAADVCTAEEACITEGGFGVCIESGCASAGECNVAPPTGNASVSCEDLNEDAVGDCFLACSGGQTCPDGMLCVDFFVCVWPFPPGVCPDEDIGNTVPQVAMGDNTGLGDDHVTSCGDGGGEDAMYRFTAPAAGMYTFDTVGTLFDTILVVLDGCGGMELACNDDAVGLTSEVTVNLANGQTVIIVVEGFGGATGPFTLNIN